MRNDAEKEAEGNELAILLQNIQDFARRISYGPEYGELVCLVYIS